MVTLRVQILVSRTGDDPLPPRVYVQGRPSVCRFKTSPCVLAPRANVEKHVRVVPAYTGDVLNLHTEAFLNPHTVFFFFHVFSACRNTHNTHTTPQHTTPHGDRDRERQREGQREKEDRERETEKEREDETRKEKKREDERGETRQDKRR